MSAWPPDYDSDPARWRSFESPRDVFELVVPELSGPILDVACGDGRLASRLEKAILWFGLDSSPTQLAANPYRPLVRGDMVSLPFPDGSFAEVTHMWCLYHLEDPVVAIREARRVLRSGGRYYACTAARDTDPELVPEGYSPSSFDAEEAVSLVSNVFEHVEVQRWDDRFYPLSTRDEVRAYCRHACLPLDRAEEAVLPLWLTKRGVLIRAARP